MRLSALSICWKMTLVYTALLIFLLAAFGIFLFFQVEWLTTRSLDKTLDLRFTQALRLSPSMLTELASGIPSISANQPKRLPTLESLAGPGLFIQIRDLRGHVVAASTNLGTTILPSGLPSKELLIRLPVAGLLPEAAGTDITEARFLLRSELVVNAAGQPAGMLQMAESLFLVDEVQDGLIDVLEQGIAGASLLAILIGVWLARRLLRPIVQITQAAQSIGRSGDLSQRILASTKPGQDEVGTLAATFNVMIAQLERAFNAQKQFVADASHELKTPLTASWDMPISSGDTETRIRI